MNSHKSLDENEEQKKANTRDVLIEREQFRSIFPRLIDGMKSISQLLMLNLKKIYAVIKQFYNFLECSFFFH